MVTFGDYFSKKILQHFHILPDARLLSDKPSYEGEGRTQELYADMQKIYKTFLDGASSNGFTNPKEELAHFNIEHRIVSAFYDSGVLNNTERDHFYNQSLNVEKEREQICVEEALDCVNRGPVQKIAPQEKSAVVRNVK